MIVFILDASQFGDDGKRQYSRHRPTPGSADLLPSTICRRDPTCMTHSTLECQAVVMSLEADTFLFQLEG